MPKKAPSKPIQQMVAAPVHFFSGALYPLKALVLIRQSPQLLIGILIPIGVNVLLAAAVYASVLFPGWQWIAQLESSLPSWAAWLDNFLQVVLAITLFVATGFLLVQFGTVLGAPWYGQLSENIEKLRIGQIPTGQISLGRISEDIGRALAFQFKKLALAAFVGVPLLVLNFFPPVGTLIASVGAIALGAILVSLDFLDPPLERRRLRFRTKLGLLVRTLPASASFSLICLGLVSVPFLNLLTVPLCVIAGTLFSCDYALPKLDSEPEKI
jgi:CysZ protein